MRKILFVILLVLSCNYILGQKTTIIPSSYVAGNASVAYDSEWLPFHNPASLGNMDQIGVSILYENKYITKQLSNKAINVWVPTKYINMGASFVHFGYAEYNEMLASVSFARKFGKSFSIGVDMIYYTMYLSQSQSYKGNFTAQVGANVMLTEDFSLAFNVFNPVFTRVKSDYMEKKLPTTFSLGSCYTIRQVVKWMVQFDKEVSSPLRWATGVEYMPVKQFIARIGAYGYNDFRPTIGAGLRLADFRFDISTDYNSVLGFSLLSSIGYQF